MGIRVGEGETGTVTLYEAVLMADPWLSVTVEEVGNTASLTVEVRVGVPKESVRVVGTGIDAIGEMGSGNADILGWGTTTKIKISILMIRVCRYLQPVVSGCRNVKAGEKVGFPITPSVFLPG